MNSVFIKYVDPEKFILFLKGELKDFSKVLGDEHKEIKWSEQFGTTLQMNASLLQQKLQSLGNKEYEKTIKEIEEAITNHSKDHKNDEDQGRILEICAAKFVTHVLHQLIEFDLDDLQPSGISIGIFIISD